METNEAVISKLAFRIAQLEVDKAVLQAKLEEAERGPGPVQHSA